MNAVLLPLSPRASAAPRSPAPIDARVIWQRGDFVYVVVGDSGSVAAGDTLLIRSGKKQVAAAPIVMIAAGGLAVARLASGTLVKQRKLDRLRVLVARLPLPSSSMIRVGFPSGKRAALRLGCDPWTLRPPGSLAYRTEPTERRNGYRLTRDSVDTDQAGSSSDAGPRTPAASWPDTIVVSLFDEAAEEEIALERGDLDVALIGSDELSTRMRESSRWTIHPVDGSTEILLLTPSALGATVRALGVSAFRGMVDCGAGGERP
ncbi:MAG: hypothetical protein AAB011_03755 [Candidatus Eisenbacteria bacterium]